MTDLYTILGVSKTASQDEIKVAYRRLAAQHHPDRGGNTQQFQEIQSAYETLGDTVKRSAYDSPPAEMHFSVDDMFHEFMSQGFNPFANQFRQPTRNRNINLQTNVTLLEAFNGKDLVADVQLPSGRTQTVTVKIPAGIHDGTVLRLTGLGDDANPGLQRGDIHLTINIVPHHEFMRQGDDLIKPIHISCIDAMLGCKINVTTLEGKTLEVNVNPGIQHEQVLSANGYGMPNMNDNRFKGRLLMPVKINIPVGLTQGQQELLSKFHQS